MRSSDIIKIMKVPKDLSTERFEKEIEKRPEA